MWQFSIPLLRLRAVALADGSANSPRSGERSYIQILLGKQDLQKFDPARQAGPTIAGPTKAGASVDGSSLLGCNASRRALELTP
jgi:hypothetical protein